MKTSYAGKSIRRLLMSACCLGAIFYVCAAPLCADDPYADAKVWIRGGGGGDVNGDGKLQSGNFRSALATPQPWSMFTMSSGFEPVISNELVRTAYRGGSMTAQTLYFPHTLTITDPAKNTGYLTPTVFELSDVLSKAGISSETYTLTIRFRPDNKQHHDQNTWILNWGNGANVVGGRVVGCGCLVGLITNQPFATTKQFIDGKVTNTITYQT